MNKNRQGEVGTLTEDEHLQKDNPEFDLVGAVEVDQVIDGGARVVPDSEMVVDHEEVVSHTNTEEVNEANQTPLTDDKEKADDKDPDGIDAEGEMNPEDDSDSDSESSCDLDEETLNILGKIPELEQSKTPEINKNLIMRWKLWMEKGIKADEKEKLLSEYNRKGSFHAEAPTLNPEVAAGVSDTVKARDKHLVVAQNCLGSAIVALGRGLSLLLDQDQEVDRKDLLQTLCDSGKLLAELFNVNSKARRTLVMPAMDKKYKNVLEEAPLDSYLFGINLKEKLDAEKAFASSGQDLVKSSQVPKKSSMTPSSSGNYRGLSSKARGRPQKAFRSRDPRKFVNFRDQPKDYYKTSQRSQTKTSMKK